MSMTESINKYYGIIEKIMKVKKAKIKGVPVTIRWFNIGGMGLGKKEVVEIISKHWDKILEWLRYIIDNKVCIEAMKSSYRVIGELKRLGFEIGENGFTRSIVDDEYRVTLIVAFTCSETMMNAETVKDIAPEDLEIDIIPLR